MSGEAVVRSDAFEAVARAGFVARGVLYGIVGILVVKLAVGSGGDSASQQGALQAVAHQPFGKGLLVLTAVGLGGYALWGFVHAAVGRGPEERDSGFDRIAALGRGLVYGALCAVAVEILVGSGGASSGGAGQSAAGILGWPGGVWLVGAAGVGLIGVGGYQGYRAVTGDFLEDSKTEEMGPAAREWARFIGALGHFARMVVFVLVGVFLLKAAIEFDPNDAVGLDGALEKVARASYGPFLLGLVAAGLIAFGLYSIADARYHRI